MNFHLDGFDRDNGDLRIPGFAHSTRQIAADMAAGNPIGSVGTLPNTSSSAWGGGVGTSYVGKSGYAGLAYSSYRTNYGTPADENVRIDMNQQRGDFAAEMRDLGGPLQSVKLKVGYSNYRHAEVDSGIPSQFFMNRGFDVRVEARHSPDRPVRRASSASRAQSMTFAVLGDPAGILLPPTQNQNYGLFMFEQAKSGRMTYQLGLRGERAKSDADPAPNLD